MKTIQLQISISIGDDAAKALAEILAPAIRVAVSPPASDLGPRTPVNSAQTAATETLLINSREAAKLLKVSERKLWTMWHSGEMPAPGKIGNAVRWGHEELRAWVNAGCPPQVNWKWPKQASGT